MGKCLTPDKKHMLLRGPPDALPSLEDPLTLKFSRRNSSLSSASLTSPDSNLATRRVFFFGGMAKPKRKAGEKKMLATTPSKLQRN